MPPAIIDVPTLGAALTVIFEPLCEKLSLYAVSVGLFIISYGSKFPVTNSSFALPVAEETALLPLMAIV